MGIEFVDGPRPENMTDLQWAEERAARMAVLLGRPLPVEPAPLVPDEPDRDDWTAGKPGEYL